MNGSIDSLRAPLLVSWQMTRDCDLACLHCCTDSAPGKALADELDGDEALKLARALVHAGVPYVMLCGGEPLMVPHFYEVAQTLGDAGVQLKIESNGQRLDATAVARLARLPVRSVQISLDADTQDVYGRQRPGGILARAHAACHAVHAAGLALEVTFAPTRINIHEAETVMQRACELGAYRFNTGRLMRIGTAARLWHKLEPSVEQYRRFLQVLDARAEDFGARMRLCYAPFTVQEALRHFLEQAPATMLVLPNGLVKVAGALPYVCADLRRHSVSQAWDAYRSAWRNDGLVNAIRRASMDDSHHAEANAWRDIPVLQT
jgi:MoaA/NifB/PqqE/SkfB family radical SAM enzyme